VGESALARDSVMSICKAGVSQGSGSRWETYEVCNEPFDQHFANCFPNHDPEDVEITQVRGEFIVWHNPALGTQERLDPFLVDVWVLGAEIL
jgi:hypothetical protein